MMLPADHPQRLELNDEVHARPPEALATPVDVSYLAMLSPSGAREREWAHVRALAKSFGTDLGERAPTHFSGDLGPFRLKWERHSEFSRYTFIAPPGDVRDPFAAPAIRLAPADWIAGLAGQTIMAAHVALRGADALPSDEEMSTSMFSGNVPVGSAVAEAAAAAFTDFHIHPDGFSRFVVRDRGMNPWQAGRLVQRLLEIDTYRVMALLALPLAQKASNAQIQWERDLERITSELAASGAKDEPGLLDRLTEIAAAIESGISATAYRFGAAAAYYELVQRRIRELREQRIAGLQTFQEFLERRLAPAMNTCRSVARRQDDISDRVARTTRLLSTRVDITREKQNQELLGSMNRRAAMQLRLQSTVEGLSIAAVTYYVVGLIGYGAKALGAFDIKVSPDLAMGASIPVVALMLALFFVRMRRHKV